MVAEAQEQLPEEVMDAGDMIRLNGFPVPTAIKFLENFASYLDNQMKEMRPIAASGQWSGPVQLGAKSVEYLAHQVKGAALQVGAKRLATACGRLEKTAKGGASDRASAALKMWFNVAEEVMQVLKTASYEALLHGPLLAEGKESKVTALAVAPDATISTDAAGARQAALAAVRHAERELTANYDAQRLNLEKIAAALSAELAQN